MRLIVTGGRDFHQEWIVFNRLSKIYSELPEDEWLWVVHGDASGADESADRFGYTWHERGLRVNFERHPADWSGPCRPTCRFGHRRWRRNGGSYCPAAGNYRNQEIIDAGADLVLAFPGGLGTADSIARAEAAGIKVERAILPAFAQPGFLDKPEDVC